MIGKKKSINFTSLPPEVRNQFEKLKTGIILSGKSKAARLFLLASYHHGEGTTTVAVNFAESLAQDKKHKVLLVDANTRTPGIRPIPGAYNHDNNIAFSDLLAPRVGKLTLPKPPPTSNVSLILSGEISHHPAEVFNHERFAKFIQSVTKLFDFVILDSSPVGQYYDSIVLASHVDAVILVVQAEKTQYRELSRAKQILQDAHAPILGVVMNRRRFHIPTFVFESIFR